MGPPNSIRTEKVAPVSRRKEMGRSDTTMITQSSLLGMAVVRPREPGVLSVIHGSLLEVDLGLRSPCLEGHEDSQHPSIPHDDTLDMVRMVYKGSDRPILTACKAGT